MPANYNNYGVIQFSLCGPSPEEIKNRELKYELKSYNFHKSVGFTYHNLSNIKSLKTYRDIAKLIGNHDLRNELKRKKDSFFKSKLTKEKIKILETTIDYNYKYKLDPNGFLFSSRFKHLTSEEEVKKYKNLRYYY